MAPEQVTGGGVGPPADLFSLGLTLSEMLTGRPVVSSDNALEILSLRSSGAHVELEPRVRASALGPILERATQTDPSRRFSTAEEMLRAMEQLPIGTPQVQATPTHDREIFVTAPTEATPAMSRSGDARRRLPIVQLAVAAACVAGLGTLGVILFRGSPREATEKEDATAQRPTAEQAPVSSASAAAAGATSGQPSVSGELRTLTPPFPPGGFEKDPRRQASLAHLERSVLRERVERAGYTISIERSLGPDGMFVDAAKDGCLVNVTWFEMPSPKAAAERARQFGEAAAWRSPVVSSGQRMLSIGGGDLSEAASRACVESLLEVLLKSAPIGK